MMATKTSLINGMNIEPKRCHGFLKSLMNICDKNWKSEKENHECYFFHVTTNKKERKKNMFFIFIETISNAWLFVFLINKIAQYELYWANSFYTELELVVHVLKQRHIMNHSDISFSCKNQMIQWKKFITKDKMTGNWFNKF